jgi:ABC-2 type transport system permease protein
VTVKAEDAESARQAVDSQQAAVAVIIPEDFSGAVTQPGKTAEVEIYRDPTLTLGPGIVTAVVEGFTNGFSGSKIAIEVTLEQLAQTGYVIPPEEINAFVNEYVRSVSAVGGEVGLFAVENTAGEAEPISTIAGVIRLVMAAMMIFYAYFTSANTVMSLLREEERGTLPRLFTTPTSRREILSGKFLSAAITVFVQVAVLLAFGAVVFDFNWGDPWLAFLVALGITLSASAFGVLVVSLMKSTKQAGIVMGVGITVTGMIGMIRIFTQMASNGASGMNTLSLLVPQGWALQAIQISAEGGSLNAMLGSLAGLLGWTLVCFVLGNMRFNRRYA